MRSSHSVLLPSLLALAPSFAGAETVVGAYLFHRHGDRTPKALAPTNLTTLGYDQVFASGSYFRSRWLTDGSPQRILGLNSDLVKLSQLSVTSPVDNVLQSSATGFLQGLYPPAGEDATALTLANTSTVQAPMNGYQIIPVNIVSSGTNSEDSGWLQDASGCANADFSSNRYFSSAEYQSTLASTNGFYDELYPVVNGTFAQSQVTFKNAYIIFDLINVATIHNSTINSSDVLTTDNLFQTRTLADAHEWGLAFNASDNARAIAGMQLAGEILTYLNTTISGKGAAKLGIQFGAYASFFSFWGLSNMTAASPNFRGIPDYASSMVLELFTDDNVTTFPATSDLRVRFLFHNGTASNTSTPTVFPMFGQSEDSMSWTDFSSNMTKIAVMTTEEWCTLCGNTTGTCAPFAPTSNSSSPTAQSTTGGGHGMSAAVGGVIGAMVTLAVILGLEGLALVFGGLRLTRKGSTATAAAAGAAPAAEAKA